MHTIDTALEPELGECRTLWCEREQAACILVNKERIRYQKFLSVSKVTIVVGSLWWHIVGTNLAEPIIESVDSNVGIARTRNI